MAQVYTDQKITRIHSRRLAVEGRLYKSESGVLYIGNAEGFLERNKDLRGDSNNKTLENTNTSIDGRPVTAPTEQGDIMVDNGTSIVPIPVGEPEQYLTPDEEAETGVAWKNLPEVSGLSWSAARKKRVTNSYLEMNEIFMNEVPIVIAQDMVLDTIIASTPDSEEWVAEIHDNGTLITGASVALTGVTDNSITDLDITLSAGTRLMFYVNGEGITKPRITIICKL